MGNRAMREGERGVGERELERELDKDGWGIGSWIGDGDVR